MLTKAFFMVRRQSASPPSARRLLPRAAAERGSGASQVRTVTTCKIEWGGVHILTPFLEGPRVAAAPLRVYQRGCA